MVSLVPARKLLELSQKGVQIEMIKSEKSSRYLVHLRHNNDQCHQHCHINFGHTDDLSYNISDSTDSVLLLMGSWLCPASTWRVMGT